MNVSQGAPSTEGEARRTKVAYGLESHDASILE